MSNLTVLLLILAFLTLTVGSFIFYVATWDQRKTERSFILVQKLPPEAPSASS